MAEVNLSKALKSKNRQVRLVNDLKKRIQEHNSVVEGTRRPFDIEKTYQELKSAVDKLVEIKAAINAANGPIQQHIYRMAELRGLAQFLRNMHVQEGAVYQYGMTAPANYEATFNAADIEELVQQLEAEADDLQDEVDAHNATVRINIPDV